MSLWKVDSHADSKLYKATLILLHIFQDDGKLLKAGERLIAMKLSANI